MKKYNSIAYILIMSACLLNNSMNAMSRITGMFSRPIGQMPLARPTIQPTSTPINIQIQQQELAKKIAVTQEKIKDAQHDIKEGKYGLKIGGGIFAGGAVTTAAYLAAFQMGYLGDPSLIDVFGGFIAPLISGGGGSMSMLGGYLGMQGTIKQKIAQYRLKQQLDQQKRLEILKEADKGHLQEAMLNKYLEQDTASKKSEE